jgi:hypothetical protein
MPGTRLIEFLDDMAGSMTLSQVKEDGRDLLREPLFILSNF